MALKYNKYIYEGPVMEFDMCVTDHWKGETYAVSENKARSNLAYQYKKRTHRTSDAKLTLPGKIERAE